MDLKGHRSQIMTAAFSPDNKRAVTASKDLTLRIWNIDVRYSLSEDPKTLLNVRGQRHAHASIKHSSPTSALQ